MEQLGAIGVSMTLEQQFKSVTEKNLGRIAELNDKVSANLKQANYYANVLRRSQQSLSTAKSKVFKDKVKLAEKYIKDVDSGELRCRIWTNLGSMNTLLVVANYMDGSKYGVDLYSSSNTSRSYANLVEEAHRLVKHFNLAVETHSKK